MEFFTVYLNLFEEDPYTNVLAEGIALTLEEGKAIMNELMYVSNLHILVD